MKYIKQNLRNQFPVDDTASDILNTLEGRLSNSLLNDIREYLLGFQPGMQLEIANYMLDCTMGRSVHYTGLKYTDRMLKAFYLLISEELNRDLGELILVHRNGSH